MLNKLIIIIMHNTVVHFAFKPTLVTVNIYVTFY